MEKTVCLLAIWCLLQGVQCALPQGLGGLVGKAKVHRPAEKEGRGAAEGDIADACTEHVNTFVWGQKSRGEDQKLDPCVYFECKGKNYIEGRCPDGRGVTNGFKNKWRKKSAGFKKNPCKSKNKKCKRTLADKGLADMDTKLCQMDLIFAIDISCSISDEDRPKVRDFVLKTINALHVSPITTQIGGIGFSKRTSHISYLNEYYYAPGFIRRSKSYARIKFSLKSDTNPLGFHWRGPPCGTRGDLALELIHSDYFREERGDRPAVTNVVMYLSDGVTYPENFKQKTIQQAKKLKDAGAIIIVIALPNKMRPMSDGVEEWYAIASGPENVFMLDSFDQLQVIIKKLARKACQVL